MWFGLNSTAAISATGGHVVGIYLEGNNLNGTITSGLQNLSYLGELNLQNNALSGTIDTSDNTALQQLFLYQNPDITSVILPATSTLTEI